MRLNKATTHAIRLLVACARAGDEYVKVAELSETLELTQQNTFKVVHLLSRAGLVQPMRGRHGGVRLARPAAEISIGDVVRAMEMAPADAPHLGEQAGASEQIALIDEAFEAFLAVLDASSIADMAAAATAEASRPKRRRRKSIPAHAASTGAAIRRRPAG